MIKEYLFPYESVPRGSKVVIYGAGTVGVSFLRQLIWTNYASVVCLMDRDIKVKQDLIVPVIRPQVLPYKNYDYLIIALDKLDVATEVKNELVKRYDIPEQRIVLGAGRGFPLNGRIHLPLTSSSKDKRLRVAFFLPGGLGDCLRARKPILAMLRFLEDIPCEIMIYGNHAEFLQLAYEDLNLPVVEADEEHYREEAVAYDMALYVGYFWGVDSFHEERFVELAPNLLEHLHKFCNCIREYGLDPARVTDNGLHYARCRLRGMDAYTAFNMSGIFDMDDKLPYLPRPAMKSGCPNIPYITLNVGWGVSGMPSSKLWPLMRWETLVKFLKREYPNFKVIQLGDAEAPRLKSVDEWYLGSPFDEVKRLLSYAQIHLDTEGGLVHLATHLGTKCVVLFGPTPVYYFGYHENDNILAGSCHDCCQIESAYWVCCRRMTGPPCMEAISVELVMEHIRNNLNLTSV